MAPRRRDSEWDPHRETIQQLYVDENKGASEVTSVLASRGFDVTNRQLKGMVKKWRMIKHYKRKEKNAMLLIQERRRAQQGKETVFRKYKKIVPVHTLQRFHRDQRNSGVGLDPDLASMSGVSYRTPSQNGETNQQLTTEQQQVAPIPLPSPTKEDFLHIGSSFKAPGPPQLSLLGFVGCESPLHAAIKNGTGEVSSLLSTGARVESMDSDDNTPLHLAASQGDASDALLLLQNRAPVDILNKSQMTPLSCAIASPRGGTQVAALLLQHGADPNFRLRNGSSPLHAAVASGNPAMVSLLLSYGADVASRDHAHETPLGSAVARGQPAVVELLIRACPRAAAAVALQDRLLPRAVKMGFPRVADLLRRGCGVVDEAAVDLWADWPCDALLADEVF